MTSRAASRQRFAADSFGRTEGEIVNERANSKICGATGFRLAVVFVADVYVIRRRVFLSQGYAEGVTEGRRGENSGVHSRNT